MDEAFYRQQRELMLNVVAASDLVITTAAVPGKKAPTLVTAEMVAAMATGSGSERPGVRIVDTRDDAQAGQRLIRDSAKCERLPRRSGFKAQALNIRRGFR
jgi:hypothetical protein